MKKLMFAIFLAVLIGCSKEPTPEPIPSEVCLECLDSLTMKRVTMCDDTMTIRVWGEYFDFENQYNGHKWTCTLKPFKP